MRRLLSCALLIFAVASIQLQTEQVMEQIIPAISTETILKDKKSKKNDSKALDQVNATNKDNQKKDEKENKKADSEEKSKDKKDGKVS